MSKKLRVTLVYIDQKLGIVELLETLLSQVSSEFEKPDVSFLTRNSQNA